MLSILFKKRQQEIDRLVKEVLHLKSQVDECSSKLALKQEQINKTNAYWKKKLRGENSDTKKSSFKKNNQ